MRPDIHKYYMDMLKLVAARSTCQRRAVGAIVTTSDGRLLSTGYNGVPHNFVHCIDKPCLGIGDAKGDSSRCLAVHAEQNALLQCERLDLAERMYVSCTPCFTCAKMILNTPIHEVYAFEEYPGGVELLMSKVIIRIYEPDTNQFRLAKRIAYAANT